MERKKTDLDFCKLCIELAHFPLMFRTNKASASAQRRRCLNGGFAENHRLKANYEGGILMNNCQYPDGRKNDVKYELFPANTSAPKSLLAAAGTVLKDYRRPLKKEGP